MRARGPEIVVVDDSPADAEFILHALEEQYPAIRVEVLRDGEEALERLFRRGRCAGRPPETPPRLILLDLKLPKVDGLEVLQQLKSDPGTCCIPVVMLTSSNLERDVVQAYRLGVNSYVQKPVEFARFRECVADVARYWLGVNEPPPTAALGGGA